MFNYFVAYGNWKLRFAQPTLDDSERLLRLYRLPADLDASSHTLLEDLAAQIDTNYCIEISADGAESVGSQPAKTSNLFGDEIPLAVVEHSSDKQYRIHHRLTRIDPWIVHLIRIGSPVFVPERTLWKTLAASFDKDHLQLNNWECFYIKGLPDTELEQKFHIEGNFPYFSVCKAWWERVDGRQIPGVVPQLGDEIQYWSYDNHFCEITENTKGDNGYVSVMQYCKRKSSWDDPLFTFKKKVFNEDALERWERNYENQWLQGDPVTALSEYFDYPLKRLPDWRRTRLDLACEITETGNLFMVNFEDCRVHGAHENATGNGRLQQCEIEYLKTRGTPDESLIYRDFERITQEVERFMDELGLKYQRTNYSKLTFLREYVAEQPALA
ncbi:hypothetical protein C5U62_32595 [Pseudomonas protegens]|uniref:Uncharacterized protein n=1 Tax=Pseudomonas protegens TaxID=380021 RepID=A0A2T6GAX7_9PSED|nr:hypothetical protein [Pseudomonas protegens]PUA41315.1 hypothetical protein C5U62_32595 [Pseudomonas protegens]